MIKKENSVKWLFKWFNDNYEATNLEFASAFKQAEAMHKKEIKQAYEQGYMDKDFSFYQADDYYHQKYNDEV